MSEHGTYWDAIDADAIADLREIYARYNVPHIIDARFLDFHSRKDGKERTMEADSIKSLLRYLPALLRIAEANPDPKRVFSEPGSQSLAD